MEAALLLKPARDESPTGKHQKAGEGKERRKRWKRRGGKGGVERRGVSFFSSSFILPYFILFHPLSPSSTSPLYRTIKQALNQLPYL